MYRCVQLKYIHVYLYAHFDYKKKYLALNYSQHIMVDLCTGFRTESLFLLHTYCTCVHVQKCMLASTCPQSMFINISFLEPHTICYECNVPLLWLGRYSWRNEWKMLLKWSKILLFILRNATLTQPQGIYLTDWLMVGAFRLVGWVMDEGLIQDRCRDRTTIHQISTY